MNFPVSTLVLSLGAGIPNKVIDLYWNVWGVIVHDVSVNGIKILFDYDCTDPVLIEVVVGLVEGVAILNSVSVAVTLLTLYQFR